MLCDRFKFYPESSRDYCFDAGIHYWRVSFILYGMISAIGVRNVVENHVDFTKSRNLIIAGVILVSGLGFSDGLTFTIGSTSITLTSLPSQRLPESCSMRFCREMIMHLEKTRKEMHLAVWICVRMSWSRN